jgi:hypothetical protein
MQPFYYYPSLYTPTSVSFKWKLELPLAVFTFVFKTYSPFHHGSTATISIDIIKNILLNISILFLMILLLIDKNSCFINYFYFAELYNFNYLWKKPVYSYFSILIAYLLACFHMICQCEKENQLIMFLNLIIE